MTALNFWIILGIVFLLIEFFTATTYGLGIALSAFITAFLAYIFRDVDVTLMQVILFLILTTVAAITFPKVLNSKRPLPMTGAASYVGRTTTLVKNEDQWKVVFDGVEYQVDAEDKRFFRQGKEVQVVDAQSGILIVDKIRQESEEEHS